ncbi:MAG: nitrite reductase [NAD(P)H], small subunit [Osedax symbiont Rs2]|nr:MAG: nitrite reductase [NAD(P)H], small subunit [Osedax symbiont Rs2]
MNSKAKWIDICQLHDIPTNTGVCADLQGQQVALFHLRSYKSDGESQVKAVANFDPFSKANVLSRGLITEQQDKYYIASPLLKQQFCLDSGLCEQDESVSIRTFDSRIHRGLVQLREVF